jgi:hypothetical protein
MVSDFQVRVSEDRYSGNHTESHPASTARRADYGGASPGRTSNISLAELGTRSTGSGQALPLQHPTLNDYWFDSLSPE